GPWATRLIAGAVLVSTLGAVNGVVMTAARIYYAMSRDGLFFTGVGRVHERFQTPHVALWDQGIWAAALTLSGRYDQLIVYATFASLLIYAGGIAALFRLRVVAPDVRRPYRVPFFPIVPASFLLAVIVMIAATLRER